MLYLCLLLKCKIVRRFGVDRFLLVIFLDDKTNEEDFSNKTSGASVVLNKSNSGLLTIAPPIFKLIQGYFPVPVCVENKES